MTGAGGFPSSEIRDEHPLDLSISALLRGKPRTGSRKGAALNGLTGG